MDGLVFSFFDECFEIPPLACFASTLRCSFPSSSSRMLLHCCGMASVSPCCVIISMIIACGVRMHIFSLSILSTSHSLCSYGVQADCLQTATTGSDPSRVLRLSWQYVLESVIDTGESVSIFSVSSDESSLAT